MGYSGHSVSESHPRFRLVFTHSSALDTDQATATKGAVFLGTLPFLFAVFARLQRTLLFNPPVEIQTQTLEGSPVFFSQGLNTPFFSSQELLGTLPFLFAIFAHFAVRFIADAPVRNLNREQRERREHRNKS